MIIDSYIQHLIHLIWKTQFNRYISEKEHLLDNLTFYPIVKKSKMSTYGI